MKSFALLSLLFGSLTASAFEVPESIHCMIYQSVYVNGTGTRTEPQFVSFSQEEMNHGTSKLVGNYEDIILSLDISLPKEEYNEHNLQVILGESNAANTSHVTLVSSHMEERVSTFSYRKAGSNRFVFINCRAR